VSGLTHNSPLSPPTGQTLTGGVVEVARLRVDDHPRDLVELGAAAVHESEQVLSLAGLEVLEDRRVDLFGDHLYFQVMDVRRDVSGVRPVGQSVTPELALRDLLL
jgi:hypothetical protein